MRSKETEVNQAINISTSDVLEQQITFDDLFDPVKRSKIFDHHRVWCTQREAAKKAIEQSLVTHMQNVSNENV